MELRKVKYYTDQEKRDLTSEATTNGEVLIEESNIVTGNFLTFCLEDEILKPTLQEYQQNKIIELNTLCNQTILNGFSSTCTGIEHQYKFDMEYQGNITQQGVMLTMDPTIETVMWPTSDAGVLSHTREQFIQLCKDAQAWKATNIYRYFELKAQVEACTVIADVEAFVW